MKKYILFLLLITVNVLLALSKEEILENFVHEEYCFYQDILINGELLKQGTGPDCASRYKAIKKSLQSYRNRPIKVLDIGANNGYFSLRIAQDFDALCVMFDFSDSLTDICRLNDKVDGLIYFKKELSLEDLKILAQEEHFDVVLALNVIHYMASWKEMIDVIFALGNTIIIENPPPYDERGRTEPSLVLIEEYLQGRRDAQIIAQTTRFSLQSSGYLLQESKGFPHVAKMFYFKNHMALPVQQSLKQSIFDSFNVQYACSEIKLIN